MIQIITTPIPDLPGIEFGIYPITQTQYQTVMGVNPSHFKGDNRPVECVSWHDAMEFCQKLSAQTSRYYRLPTTAEWEMALGGQVLSVETGWFHENSNGEAHPVGKLEHNKFGLFDMHGNVWEWCEDVVGDKYRALRGGSWASSHMLARAVGRGSLHPADRRDDIGFRVLCCGVSPSSLTTDERVARSSDTLKEIAVIAQEIQRHSLDNPKVTELAEKIEILTERK